MDIAVRFFEKADKSQLSPGGCWIWKAGTVGGYGTFRFKGKMRKAHRVSFELTYGPIPEGKGVHGNCILHRCDERACVNPAHLVLGSQEENMIDMLAKGRHRTQRMQGERNGAAKLTQGDVVDIRTRYASGGISQRELGKLFGISQNTVSHIVRHETWTHVA